MEKNKDKKKEIIALVYAAVAVWSSPLIILLAADDLGSLWGRLIYLLTTASIYGVLMSTMKRRHMLWLLSPMLLLYLADLVPVVAYGTSPTLLYTYTLLAAEPGETFELFSTYLPLILLILAVWVGYFILTFKYVSKEYFFPQKVRRIVGYVSGGWLLLAVIGGFAYIFTDRISAFRTVVKVTPMNEVYNLSRISYLKHQVRSGRSEMPSYRFDATSTAQDDELVVLLLGETGRYGNWQVNGYDRPNSPHMMARGEQLLSYDSCYSVANLTTVAVPLILSRATPLEMERFYEEPSVMRAFRESGFSTAWIADQSFANPFLMYISGQCDYVYYHNVKHTFYDMDLLPHLQECMSTLSGKQMITLHSLGSHFNYSARYPEEIARFKPDLYDVSGKDLFSLRDWDGFTIDAGHPQSSVASIAQRILTNSYDNTICYIDSFIDSVICTLEQSGRPCVLLYVADHGENLLDDDRHMMLHGQGLGTIYEYHVPLFVWASESYKERYPDRWDALKSNTSKHISTMNVYHTLLDFGSITMPTYQSDMSLASPFLKADTVSYKLDGDLHPVPFSTSEPE